MSKGRCPNRAEWRFEPGKPAKQLSPHYRLDCDDGTAVMVCREQGGSEPVYLCAGHAEQLKHRIENQAEGRRAGGGDSACGSAKPKVEPTPDGTPEKPTGDGLKKTGATDNNNRADEAIPPGVSQTPASAVAPKSEAIKTEEFVSKPAATESDSSRHVVPESTSVPPEVLATKSDVHAKVEEPAASEPVRPAEKDELRLTAAPKAVRPAKDLSARAPARDVAFGNPTKAIVDEAIWNLPSGDHEVFRTALQNGKPAAEAAQAAGGLLAAVHRRVSEYSLKLDAVLGASAKTISVQDTIDTPLEQAMVAIIESDSMTDSEKDAAVQQLGALQEWAKCGVRAQFTPLEANRGLLAIGQRMNWGGPNEIPERLKPAYRALFASLKKAIHAAVPDAQELHERIVNLHAAKSDLLAAPVPELLPR